MKTIAEIITIGDELLIGQVLDTNSAWMGKQLNAIGISINRITSVRDDKKEIIDALDEALTRAQVVLVTGGLGPTKDDITKKTLCDYFKTELVFDPIVYANIEKVLAGRTAMNKLNRSQAYVPKDCTVITNKVGSAPITWFDHKSKVVVSMPGVPQEMKVAMVDEVLPRLQKQFATNYIVHHTFFVKNYPEAILAETIEAWEDNLPLYIKLAYLPQPGAMRIRLTAQGDDKSKLEDSLEAVESQLYQILDADIFLENEQPIEQQVGELLLQHKMFVATAESCTGGNIAARITKNPGSSAYFRGGIVSYCNTVKMKQLGVLESTLDAHGAVSEETAIEMVKGVCRELDTECGMATTGIAGPTGGVPGKPVGTVWIAVKCRDRVVTRLLNYDHGRDMNIERASNHALILLMEELQHLK